MSTNLKSMHNDGSQWQPGLQLNFQKIQKVNSTIIYKTARPWLSNALPGWEFMIHLHRSYTPTSHFDATIWGLRSFEQTRPYPCRRWSVLA